MERSFLVLAYVPGAWYVIGQNSGALQSLFILNGSPRLQEAIHSLQQETTDDGEQRKGRIGNLFTLAEGIAPDRDDTNRPTYQDTDRRH